jgi:hypothetical protein
MFHERLVEEGCSPDSGLRTTVVKRGKFSSYLNWHTGLSAQEFTSTAPIREVQRSNLSPEANYSY